MYDREDGFFDLGSFVAEFREHFQNVHAGIIAHADLGRRDTTKRAARKFPLLRKTEGRLAACHYRWNALWCSRGGTIMAKHRMIQSVTALLCSFTLMPLGAFGWSAE